jgi:hypothetical protein
MSIVKPQREAFFKPPREFKKRGVGGFPIGPRTERRAKENRELGKLKITRCEIRIKGICVDRIMLTWCHSLKSRFILDSKHWQEAARGCLPCHAYIEKLPHKEMAAIIRAAIKRRKTP